jgi:hypothetical protein
MKQQLDHSDILELFGEPALHIWVLEYGITHSVMRLAIHKGDYPKHLHLMMESAKSLDIGIDQTWLPLERTERLDQGAVPFLG